MVEDGGRPYAGLYWTFPVPWAGFTSLPADADAAAAASRTVRYQRDRVRAHVAAEGGTLVREFVFLETSPDRGTDAFREVLDGIIALCGPGRVRLCYVNFAERLGWRRHGRLLSALHANRVRAYPVAPDPIRLDGEAFDPAGHFARWRDIDDAFRSERALTAAEALAAAADAQPPGRGRHGAIADRLNGMGVATHSGRPWTPDNVRMALKALEGGRGG